MNSNSIRRIGLLAFIMFLLSSGMRAVDCIVTSPNKQLTATIHMVDGRLSYSVTKNNRLVVKQSPLGLSATEDLTQGLTMEVVSYEPIDDRYTLPAGKQSQYRDHCNMLSVTVSKGTWRMTVEMRAYDDGFGFRYVIPDSNGNTNITLNSDASRVIANNFSSVVCQRFIGNVQSPNWPHEGFFNHYSSWSDLISKSDNRMTTPTLVYNGTDYLLISEAANTGNFCVSFLKPESQQGEFSFALAGQTKNYATDGQHSLTCSLPLETPWRMVAIGDLASIFETTITENLCPPCKETDLDWIKPGRSAWYWGGSDGNTNETRGFYGGQKEGEQAFIDLAADMGWEYTMFDGGWNTSWLYDLIAYANSKGVDAMLWQTARLNNSQDFSLDNMEATLQRWQSHGIKGIKIDFWEDDSQETMFRMEKLLKLAGKYHMLVNLHGCTRPSGLRRTYPHLMTQEAVWGGENFYWDPTSLTSQHHLNLVFTRNVVGGMDYTPGDLARFFGPILTTTTMAHKLALLTLFESGICHIAESPENLNGFIGRDIMKRIPVAWDESKLLEGNITQYATTARRKGEDWWVAGINVNARTCQVPLNFLEAGKTYTAYIYSDGTCSSDVAFEKRTVTSSTELSIPELADGGFLIQISPDANLDVPATIITYEAESLENTITGLADRRQVEGQHASGGAMVYNMGQGSAIHFNNVEADRDGLHLITIYYTTKENRYARLLVNGSVVQNDILFHDNSCTYDTWNAQGMGWKKIPVNLNAGTNTITIQAPDNGWSPNFDRIDVQPMSKSPTNVAAPSSEPGQGQLDSRSYNLHGLPIGTDYKGIRIQDGKKLLK